MWVLDGEKIGATQAHKSGISRDISTCSEPPRRVTKVGIDFCRERHPNCTIWHTHDGEHVGDSTGASSLLNLKCSFKF